MNRVAEAVQLTQVTPSATPKCATVQSGQDAAFAVALQDVYQVVGVTSSTVYFSNFVIYGTLNTMEIIPASPSGPPPPAVQCKVFKWKPILMATAASGLALLGALYVGKPSLPPLTALENMSSDAYLRTTTQQRKASRAFNTALVVVMAVVGLVALLWCWAEGPCSKRATCGQCQARGGDWVSAKPRSTDSLLNKWACNYLGRCSCESPLMEQKCRLFAAQKPEQAMYQWDATFASRQFKAGNTAYLCACCEPGDKNCVNCQQPDCQSCQQTQ